MFSENLNTSSSDLVIICQVKVPDIERENLQRSNVRQLDSAIGIELDGYRIQSDEEL